MSNAWTKRAISRGYKFTARRFAEILTRMKALLVTGLILASIIPAYATEVPTLSPAATFAARRLKREGFKKDFIELVQKSYDENTRNDIVALNVLGFLSKPADYDKHFSLNAVKETLKFLKENQPIFDEVKAKHNVDPEIIASLLWVETKHGRQLGNHSVMGVYYSLLQADHPTVMDATHQALETKVDKVTKEYKKKLRERSKSKAKWALEELRFLSKIKKKDKDVPIESLKGSFAGAFGYSQFIPSAYYRFARSAESKKFADLFQTRDAIHSVAFYLRKHGYRSKSINAQKRALFSYNRATGYVDVILRIADCARREEPALSTRKLASQNMSEPACR